MKFDYFVFMEILVAYRLNGLEPQAEQVSDVIVTHMLGSSAICEYTMVDYRRHIINLWGGCQTRTKFKTHFDNPVLLLFTF